MRVHGGSKAVRAKQLPESAAACAAHDAQTEVGQHKRSIRMSRNHHQRLEGIQLIEQPTA